jgi:gliding motility-associated-like protein
MQAVQQTRKWLILSILTIVALSSHAQNLVPNPSFEQVNKMPCDIYVTNITETKMQFNAVFKNWMLPTYATTDPYSLLSDRACLTYPIRDFWDMPAPKHGNNMIGLYTTRLGNQNYREYVSVELNDKLDVGHQYLCGFYVASSSESNSSANVLGMYFSTDTVTHSYDDTFVFSLNYSPQVTFATVNDDKNWKLYFGYLTSEQEFAHLTIGNFRDRAQDNGYNLIDSVFVERIEKLIIPNVITPNGDCCNNKFEIIGLQINRWNLKIFNRWGQEVYYSKNYSGDWDGGNLASGVYYYHLAHRFVDISYKGTLTIFY